MSRTLTVVLWMVWDSNPTTFVISNGRLNLYDALPVELSIQVRGLFDAPSCTRSLSFVFLAQLYECLRPHPPSIPKCQQIQFT